MVKYDELRFLDNPDLEDLKTRRIRNVALIDDSIGTGLRVADFIQTMMRHKSFLSWWSLGWIKLHILAFARTVEAKRKVIQSIPGSDHHTRKYPKSTKVRFVSDLVYQETNLKSRWGTNCQAVLDLCLSQKVIPKTVRLGFGETMANIVFYHSVPDNIPGMLWFNESQKWTPLFPNRALPEWLPPLLDSVTQSEAGGTKGGISESLLALLWLTKKGVTRESSLAFSLGLDVVSLREILSRGRDSGFLTEGNRLTETGLRVIRAEMKGSSIPLYDRSLYIPKKWCVGRGTVQPFGTTGGTRCDQTDPMDGSLSVGGEAGQASLERTDATTASPSISVMPHKPAKTRKGHDTHGPQGLHKET
jgi:hypothetical protein